MSILNSLNGKTPYEDWPDGTKLLWGCSIAFFGFILPWSDGWFFQISRYADQSLLINLKNSVASGLYVFVVTFLHSFAVPVAASFESQNPGYATQESLTRETIRVRWMAISIAIALIGMLSAVVEQFR